MNFITEVTLDGEIIANPTWVKVSHLLDQIFSNRRGFLQLLGPMGALMTVCPSAEFGCFVSAFGKNELGEHLLVEPSLGLSPVETALGGSCDTFPRCVFVGNSLVSQAVAKFLETGDRTRDLSWADPFEIYAEAGLT